MGIFFSLADYLTPSDGDQGSASSLTDAPHQAASETNSTTAPHSRPVGQNQLSNTPGPRILTQVSFLSQSEDGSGLDGIPPPPYEPAPQALPGRVPQPHSHVEHGSEARAQRVLYPGLIGVENVPPAFRQYLPTLAPGYAGPIVPVTVEFYGSRRHVPSHEAASRSDQAGKCDPKQN